MLIWHRAKRCLPLVRGWPRRCIGLTAGPSQLETIALLKTDHCNYLTLQRAFPDAAAKTLKRSIFVTVAVQQAVQLVQDSKWQPSKDIKELARIRGRVVIGSQIIEDAFKRQSRACDANTNRTTQMEKMFHVILQRQVLSKVHKYDEVEASIDVLAKSAMLPKAIFDAHS